MFERLKKALVGREDDIRPGAYSVAGIAAVCSHCKGTDFGFGTARVRIIQGRQFDTQFGSPILYTLTCNACLHIDHFAKRPKRE